MAGGIFYPPGGGGGGSGVDNLRTVADITARDALTPNADEIVFVEDASADPEVSSGGAWYQYDSNDSTYRRYSPVPASETTPGVLAIASQAEAEAGTASDKVMTPERVADQIATKTITYNATSTTDLQTNYPASANPSRFAYVNAGNATDGLYRSNGTTWVKVMDDSGDRTALYNYSGGLVHSGNFADLRTAGGSTQLVFVSDGSNAHSSGNGSEAFDGSTSSMTLTNQDHYLVDDNVRCIKNLNTADSYGIFKITGDNAYQQKNSLKEFSIEGYNGSTWEELTVDSVSGAGTHAGNIVTINDGSLQAVTVTTTNSKEYDAYCVRMRSAWATQTDYIVAFTEFEGQTVVDNSNTINAVSAINKLQKGYQGAGATATASAVDLEDDSEIIQISDTSSNAVTYTLPAVADNNSNGKVFIFRVEDATNPTIIDGESSEQVGGANTQILDEVGEVMMIRCNGTAWDILFHYIPSVAGMTVPEENFTTTLKNKLDNIEANATAGVSEVVASNSSNGTHSAGITSIATTVTIDEADHTNRGANVRVEATKQHSGYTSHIELNFFRAKGSSTWHYVGRVLNTEITQGQGKTASFTSDSASVVLTSTGTTLTVTYNFSAGALANTARIGAVVKTTV